MTPYYDAATTKAMGAEGSVDFEGFSGTYSYELHSGELVCVGMVRLERLAASVLEAAVTTRHQGCNPMCPGCNPMYPDRARAAV